ncbi:hypothetical protein BCR35DRAFT_199441 [Leucosporidium creatinivorum]|uniref:Uncharacterized protein n=1 Tax=Leucosporidium creatinivorum TaxID=106004 RepID=A0A1Y2DKU3_9BASI|nr:hypothetical protein BCR35DRAFT_199441 [Leucosporidium creatinivorum]
MASQRVEPTLRSARGLRRLTCTSIDCASYSFSRTLVSAHTRRLLSRRSSSASLAFLERPFRAPSDRSSTLSIAPLRHSYASAVPPAMVGVVYLTGKECSERLDRQLGEAAAVKLGGSVGLE